MRRSAAAAYQIHKLCIAIIEVHSMQHHDSGIKETIETDDASFNSSQNLQYSDWHAESEYLLLIVVNFLAVVGVRIHLQNSINYNRNNSAAHSKMVNTCYSVVYHTI